MSADWSPLAVVVVIAVVTLGVILRAKLASDYCYALLGRVGHAAHADIKAGNLTNWKWRYDAFHRMLDESWTPMILKFWRPFASFVPAELKELA